jgi:hypothetical protein
LNATEGRQSVGRRFGFERRLFPTNGGNLWTLTQDYLAGFWNEPMYCLKGSLLADSVCISIVIGITTNSANIYELALAASLVSSYLLYSRAYSKDYGWLLAALSMLD